MSTDAMLLDMQKAFDTTWPSGVLYKLSEIGFSTNLIKLIASFLTDGKCKVMVEGEFCTAREIAGYLKVPFLPQCCTVHT
jgi:hypothetical protein